MPDATPIRRATTNHLILSPPKRRSAKRTRRTVKDVFSDLSKVWSIESLTICEKEPEDLLKFSLILSKTTIVS